jgi:hypothetical protein
MVHIRAACLSVLQLARSFKRPATTSCEPRIANHYAAEGTYQMFKQKHLLP